MFLIWVLAGETALLSKRDFRDTFPFALITISLITYGFIYVGVKSAAIWFSIFLILALAGWYVWKTRSWQKTSEQLKQRVFTSAFWIMAVLYSCS